MEVRLLHKAGHYIDVLSRGYPVRHGRLGLEHAALRRPPEREPFDTGRARRRAGDRALVEEDVNRPAARVERVRRGDGPEDRVLVVLAHGDDPHIDAVLAHERRQEGVEPLLQPGLLHRGLFAQRAEWPVRVRQRAGGEAVALRRRRLLAVAGFDRDGRKKNEHRDTGAAKSTR